MKLRSRVRSERGAELIEFSLTLPLLLLLVLGIIEFGFLFQEYEVLTNAAREGARLGALTTANYTTDEAETRIEDYMEAGGLDMAKATPAPTVTTAQVAITGTTKCFTAVTATATLQHDVPFLSGIMNFFGSSIATIPLQSVAVMRTEAATTTCP